MAVPIDPPLLEGLRRTVPSPDWRRDGTPADAPGLAARLAEAIAAGGWTAAHRAEGRYLLARAVADPVAAMEALCDLAACDTPQRGWALAEMGALGRAWALIRGRWAEEDFPALARRIDDAFGRLAAILPAEALPRLAHAAVIGEFIGAGAALDRLEPGLAAGAPILPDTLARLAGLLASRPDAGALSRALSLPEAVCAGAGSAWLAFRLHRTVAFATLWGQQAALLRDRRIDAAAVRALLALPPAELHIAGRIGDALAPVASLGPEAAAAHLIALADNLLLRLSPVPGAEAARCALVEAMLACAAGPALSAGATRRLLAGLLDLAPATLRFWSDEPFRDRVCGLVRARAGTIPDGAMAEFLRGVFAFAGGDPDAARDAFAATAAAWPDAAGPPTYLHPAAVPALLAEVPSPPDGAGLQFETLAGAAGTEHLPCVVITGNDRYVNRFGPGYAEALNAVAPAGRLHLHLVGDPAAIRDATAAMLRSLPGHAVSLSAEPLSIDAPYYFATARFLRLPWLLDRLAGPLIVTDIDAPWREAPASLLRQRVAGADVGLRLNARPECGRWPGIAAYVHLMPPIRPWHAVNASLMTFSAGPAAARFAALLARLAEGALRRAAGLSRNGAWGIDQNLLLAAHLHARRHDPGLRVADLGPPGAVSPERLPPFMRAPPGRHWILEDPAGGA